MTKDKVPTAPYESLSAGFICTLIWGEGSLRED